MIAMIFAAGLGTRLRPLTDTLPKALIEVGGISVLERVIDKIAQAGITKIIVNVHHLAPLVIDFLHGYHRDGLTVIVSDESDMLLDTGGGVVKAIPLIGESEHLLLHNVDILTDFDLDDMIASHLSRGSDATLLADRRTTSRHLLFDSDGRMTGWTNSASGEVRSPFGPGVISSSSPMAFGGVHILSPRAIRMLETYSQVGPKFSITPFYVSCCDRLDIRAYTPSGPYRWVDIGRPETLAKARELFG